MKIATTEHEPVVTQAPRFEAPKPVRRPRVRLNLLSADERLFHAFRA